MEKKNNIIEMQGMLMEQMRRLQDAIGREIPQEIGRSGALSQNAQAYLKAVATTLKVKEMSRRNPSTELELLKETGIIEE